MASIKHNNYNCLICSSNISTNEIKQVDKLDVLFLLRTLIQIPTENKLFDQIKNSLNSIQICDHCANEIKQCKEVYSEICEKIKRFREHQNKILEKFSKDPKPTISPTKKDNYNDWVLKCKEYVKDHDFTGHGYPFTVHDLETLSTNIPSSPQQLQDAVNFVPKKELPFITSENDDSVHMSEEALAVETPSPFSQPPEQNESLPIKQELTSKDEAADIQDDLEYKLDEGDNLSSDSDSDTDYQPSTSKKPKVSLTKRKYVKKVKGQVSPVKKRNRRKITDIYPNFKMDPTTKKYHCTWSADCDRQFLDKTCLLNHWDRHKGTPRRKCEDCPDAFYSRRALVCHQQKEHPKEDDKFDCDKCGRKFKTRERLLAHYRTTHDEKKEEERKLRMKEIEEDPIKRDPITKKLICWWPDCGKSYTDRCDLVCHLDRHYGTPKQKCEQCGQLFYSKCQLDLHTQKEHEKDKKFDCEICGDKFDTKSGLYGHKTFTHSEKGSGVEVVCQVCGKTYKKCRLYLHMKTAHGPVEEKTFACHLCPGMFTGKRGLKRHLWRMHQYCEDEKFKEQFEKQREKEKEKGYNWRCHVKGCRCKFMSENGLKKHVDGVHKGKWDVEEDDDGKFECQVCGKRFHLKQKLTRHVKQHEKAFQ